MRLPAAVAGEGGSSGRGENADASGVADVAAAGRKERHIVIEDENDLGIFVDRAMNNPRHQG